MSEQRGAPKMYMPGKPHKWGFKMWGRAEQSGFLYDFDVCQGAANPDRERSEVGVSGDVVQRHTIAPNCTELGTNTVQEFAMTIVTPWGHVWNPGATLGTLGSITWHLGVLTWPLGTTHGSWCDYCHGRPLNSVCAKFGMDWSNTVHVAPGGH